MKYKVGDKVRVRADLEPGEDYGLFCATREMCEFCGKTVVIKGVHVLNHSYTIEGFDEPWWTNEMFEGFAEDTKFKVGDRVKAVRTARVTKEKYIGTVYTIRELYPNGKDCFNEPHYGVKDPDCTYIWLESELELVNEEPTPTPEPTPVININVTVNNYDNACWYCRKGGLVDLYLEGAMGICPNCKRVCNDVRKGFTLTNSKVIEFTAPKRSKRPKRNNEPLTTEELYQMDGKLVWCSSLHGGCTERFNNEYCGWFKINVTEERISHVDDDTSYPFKVNGVEYGFRAYLEEPEQAKVPKPEEPELPF